MMNEVKHKKIRLEQLLVNKKLVRSRSQAESYIRLGKVLVNGREAEKVGFFVNDEAQVELKQDIQYVSRAGLKLESVAKALGLDFKGKVVLDVGASTGGFTDFALKNGATKVIAVEVGTRQMVRELAGDPRVELHEKTDIRDFTTTEKLDVIVADVSFISVREILPKLKQLSGVDTEICLMAKPQFEAKDGQTNRGVVKNERQRREILKSLETWFQNHGLKIVAKADSLVAGEKGNLERFYLLRRTKIK
jgi:23S rRNA (cytidine1920-2'-O)/16S rRNA (cytidine1409-2'-O)-methyltransferase